MARGGVTADIRTGI